MEELYSSFGRLRGLPVSRRGTFLYWGWVVMGVKIIKDQVYGSEVRVKNDLVRISKAYPDQNVTKNISLKVTDILELSATINSILSSRSPVDQLYIKTIYRDDSIVIDGPYEYIDEVYTLLEEMMCSTDGNSKSHSIPASLVKDIREATGMGVGSAKRVAQYIVNSGLLV